MVQMYGSSSIFEGPTALLHHELQSAVSVFISCNHVYIKLLNLLTATNLTHTARK